MFRSVVLAAVAFVLMGNPVHAEEISLRCTFTDGSKLDRTADQFGKAITGQYVKMPAATGKP